MGRGWSVVVGLVSDTTWVTPKAWRIVSRGSSPTGHPSGRAFQPWSSLVLSCIKTRKNVWMALCHAFPLRCNDSVLFFGKGIACIAIHVGVAMGLQIFRPYGAGDGVRCSLIVIRCSWMPFCVTPCKLRVTLWYLFSWWLIVDGCWLIKNPKPMTLCLLHEPWTLNLKPWTLSFILYP